MLSLENRKSSCSIDRKAVYSEYFKVACNVKNEFRIKELCFLHHECGKIHTNK